MKKLAVALLAALGLMFGTGLAASAADGYPPGTSVAFTGPTGSVTAGSAVTFSLANAQPGSTVKFAFNGQTQTITVPASGIVKATFPGPTNPATYSASATYNGIVYKGVDVVVVAAGATTTTTVASTTTVKPTGTVPATGSNTTFAGAAIGGPVLLGGLVLLMVSRRRRIVAA